MAPVLSHKKCSTGTKSFGSTENEIQSVNSKCLADKRKSRILFDKKAYCNTLSSLATVSVKDRNALDKEAPAMQREAAMSLAEQWKDFSYKTVHCCQSSH